MMWWQTSTGAVGKDTALSHQCVCRYKEFLPWCQESRYIREGPERSYGQLSIGIPPLLERYTAMVLHSRPTAIRVSYNRIL